MEGKSLRKSERSPQIPQRTEIPDPAGCGRNLTLFCQAPPSPLYRSCLWCLMEGGHKGGRGIAHKQETSVGHFVNGAIYNERSSQINWDQIGWPLSTSARMPKSPLVTGLLKELNHYTLFMKSSSLGCGEYRTRHARIYVIHAYTYLETWVFQIPNLTLS